MEYGGSQIMEKLMNILMEIDSSIAWDKKEKLIDDRIMDSFMVEQIGKMLLFPVGFMENLLM